jgi:hypothetical protein
VSASDPSAAEVSRHLETLADAVLTGRAPAPDFADLRRSLSAIVRLYAAAVEGGADGVPVDDSVSTTDVVQTASALLRSRDLNPFDLALWFGRANA